MAGGVKGDSPHLPGQGHLPKRLRPKPSPDELPLIAKGLTRFSSSEPVRVRNSAELRYATAYALSGGQRLRKKYRP